MGLFRGMVRLAGVSVGVWLTVCCHSAGSLSFWVVVQVPTTRGLSRSSLTLGAFRRTFLVRRQPTLLSGSPSGQSFSMESDDTSRPVSQPTISESVVRATTRSTSPSPTVAAISDTFVPSRAPYDDTEACTDATSTESSTSYSEIVRYLFENTDTGSTSSGPIYVFDGVCNFCNDSVQLCYDLDTQKVLRFCSMQSTTGRAILQHFGKAPDDWSSLVLVESASTAHFQSDAVLQLVRTHLSGVPPMVRILAAVAQTIFPERIRHAAYHVVADHRHVFGSSEGPTCRVDLDPSRFVDSDVPDTIVCSD